MRRLLGIIMLAAAGTVVPAAAAAGTSPAAGAPEFGVRLLDVPVSEAKDPRALRYIIDYLRPGNVIRRRILVLNDEAHVAQFTVYADAAQISQGHFIGDVGETKSELTGWITVQHPELTLGPESSRTDLITISEPRTATRGEHYGVIWVQQTAIAHTGGVDINVVDRVGVRIYLAVGPGGMPPTTFAVTSVTGNRSAEGRPEIVARVSDTGRRAVDLDGSARLTRGPGNIAAGPFNPSQTLTLAPGQAGDVIFLPGSEIPDGPWHATVDLVSGLTTGSGAATVDFSGTAPAVPWNRRLPMVIAVTALVIGLVLLAGILLRRGQRRLGRARA